MLAAPQRSRPGHSPSEREPPASSGHSDGAFSVENIAVRRDFGSDNPGRYSV